MNNTDYYLDENDIKASTVFTKGRKSWTFRDYNLIFDKQMIERIFGVNPRAARILLTGEVRYDYLGEEPFNFLIGLNDIDVEEGFNIEPLFIATKRQTIRMSRFDPKFVWKVIGPETLMALAQDEISRLGINMPKEALEYYDFYESMIWYMNQENNDYCVPVLKKTMPFDIQFYVTYFTSLLLFNKPGYLGIPVTEYFTDPVAMECFKYMEFHSLDEEKAEEVERLRKELGHISAMTNEELIFAATLYEDE